MTTNLYETLGVARDATQAQIKAAYRKKAKQHHPDANGGDDSAQMAGINVAYEVLSDKEKRKRYDETGQTNGEKTRTDKVRELFVAAVQHVIDDDGNLILNVERLMRDSVRDGNKEVAKAQKVIDKLKRRVELIHAPEGNTLVLDILKGRIDDGNRAVASAKEKINMMNDALKMLKGYVSDEPDAGPKEDDPGEAIGEMLEAVFSARRRHR